MDFIKKVLHRLRPKDSMDGFIQEVKAAIITHDKLVRDGIAFNFYELKDGRFWVEAIRRTYPFLAGNFMVSKAEGEAWRADGKIPEGEVGDLFRELQQGKWGVPPTMDGR